MPYSDQYRKPLATVALSGGDSYVKWIDVDANIVFDAEGGKIIGRATAGGLLALVDGDNTGGTVLGWAHVSQHEPHTPIGGKLPLRSNPEMVFQMPVSDPAQIPALKVGATYGLKVVAGKQVIDLDPLNTDHIVVIADPELPGAKWGMVRAKLINSKVTLS